MSNSNVSALGAERLREVVYQGPLGRLPSRPSALKQFRTKPETAYEHPKTTERTWNCSKLPETARSNVGQGRNCLEPLWTFAARARAAP
eukprot:2077929-Alexandrium_andersonii.AAC.1